MWIGRMEKRMAALATLTFTIVLPLICRKWPHSVYFDGVDQDADDAGDAAHALNYLSLARRPRAPDVNRTSMVISIVTVRRHPDLYLTQVVARLHRLVEQCGARCSYHRVVICNVDSLPEAHVEAEALEHLYPVIRRLNEGQVEDNPIDKEKADYVFCLNTSRTMYPSSEYVMVLEDDALLLQDFFDVTHHLLAYLSRKHRDAGRDFLYLKLFHPARLQGLIQPEPWRIGEWIALATLPALCCTLWCSSRVNRKWWHHFLYFLVYFLLLTAAIGRPHVIQLRRLWPGAYSLLPATECCTPAVVYSRTSALQVAQHLASRRCRRGYAKDAVLYDYYRSGGAGDAYVVEPNLIKHIGAKSSLNRA